MVKLPDAELIPTGNIPDPIEDMEDTPIFKAAQFETDARVCMQSHMAWFTKLSLIACKYHMVNRQLPLGHTVVDLDTRIASQKNSLKISLPASKVHDKYFRMYVDSSEHA